MTLDREKTKEARENAGLSQKEVAEGTGLSAPTVSRIERGFSVHNPTARLYAEFVGVPLASLRPEKKQRKQ